MLWIVCILNGNIKWDDDIVFFVLVLYNDLYSDVGKGIFYFIYILIRYI